jgi:pilus assembly protein Flp/PilA
MTFTDVRDCLKRFVGDDKGATAIEYAMIAGATGMALVVIIYILGDTVAGDYQAAADGFK